MLPICGVDVPGSAQDIAATYLSEEYTVLNHGHAADGCAEKFVCCSNDVAIWRKRLYVPRHIILNSTEWKRHVVIGLVDNNAQAILLGYHTDQPFLFVQNRCARDLAGYNRFNDLINTLVGVKSHEVVCLYHILDDGFILGFCGIPLVPGLKMRFEVHSGTV